MAKMMTASLRGVSACISSVSVHRQHHFKIGIGLLVGVKLKAQGIFGCCADWHADTEEAQGAGEGVRHDRQQGGRSKEEGPC